MPDTATKRCTKCKQVKPLSDFNRDASRHDGLDARCRECAARHGRTSRRANLESRAAQMRRWRAAHPEALSEINQRYRVANHDAIAEQARRQRAGLRVAVLAHYGERCACCSATERLTIDHVNGGGAEHRRELFGRNAAGGTEFYRWLINENFPHGYQTLCLPCNQSKGRGKHCRLDHTGSE